MRRTISLLLAIAMPLEAWEAAPAPRNTEACATTALCCELTDTTKAIESLLHTATDTATAKASRLSQAAYYAEPELHDSLAEYATALQDAHATH